MYSKLYRALYLEQWKRQMYMTGHWWTMRKNPFVWAEKQDALDKVFGERKNYDEFSGLRID